MSEVLNMVHEEPSLRNNEASFINWSYRIDTQEFECDQQALMNQFRLDSAVESIEQLFDYIVLGQKDDARARLNKVKTQGGDDVFTCCIMPNESTLVHVECWFEKIDATYVQGTLIPQLSVRGSEELAGIIETIFELPNVGVLIADADTKILGCNAAFERQMGYQNSDIVGLKTQIFSSELHSKSFYDTLWAQVEREGFWRGNLFSLNAAGEDHAHHLCLYKLAFESGRVLYLGYSTDTLASWYGLSNGESASSHWLRLLPNKAEFEKCLTGLCGKADRHDIKMVITLAPRFKPQLLVEQLLGFSDFLMRSQHVSLAGHLTKNIFTLCIVAPKSRRLSPLRLIDVAIRNFFAELRSELGEEVHEAVLSGRTGVAVMGYDTNNPIKAMVYATQAMISAKSGVENEFNFYNSELHAQLLKRLHLERFIKEQLSQHHVDVYYQPIVDVKSGRVAAFEALARFQFQGQQYETWEIITVVEDIELILALDDLVCQSAIEQLPHLQQVYGEHIGLSLNRSLNTRQDSLQGLHRFLQFIKASSVDPRKITLELNETVFFEQDAEQAIVLDQLRQHGVGVAIDDFGTGLTSFAGFKAGQFDVLKIDRILVENLEQGSITYNMVKSITQLAHALGAKVVAEGVETVSELNALSRIGVDCMQGYVFSEALPPTQLDQPISYQKMFAEASGPCDPDATVLSICHANVHHLDPGEPLSLAVELMNLDSKSPLVVVNDKLCVGIVLKEHVSLHLTPSMGTDLETEREARVWKKPINQVMSTKFHSVEASMQLKLIPELIQAGVEFPWVVCDENHHFRGLITQEDVLSYLASRE
ncbi:EAL domain-containing protein [Vibrio sp. CAU 1672]|uniref:EAL domain-containing protein n=1 Tax=Vibrio sp. CAU 1672 TaxID=3032594 RepID=UPI0023D982E1|nr:EAL domain-containing protein [Vibrio sp. CAU 1672]MDF2154253.1 EAL domain-containing protein [Vibrio sp. CAU 1672]